MQLLTFVLNDIRFGIQAGEVLSIETRRAVTGVPDAPKNIRGIIHLHGDIIPIYRLAARFGYPEREIENIIVTGIGDMKIGLEVEHVEEILDVPDSAVITMPQIMNAASKCFQKVVSCERGLISIVEAEYLISAEEQQGLMQLIQDNT